MTLRGVGIDVAEVNRVARLLAAHGERFTTRWFTSAEIADCAADAQPAAAYALRFAAKEAVWKAISVDWSGPMPWRSIAVFDVRDAPRVELAGEVARAASAAGVGRITVALSATERLATAVALAVDAPQ